MLAIFYFLYRFVFNSILYKEWIQSYSLNSFLSSKKNSGYSKEALEDSKKDSKDLKMDPGDSDKSDRDWDFIWTSISVSMRFSRVYFPACLGDRIGEMT